jgi:hypothetical protein
MVLFMNEMEQPPGTRRAAGRGRDADDPWIMPAFRTQPRTFASPFTADMLVEAAESIRMMCEDEEALLHMLEYRSARA